MSRLYTALRELVDAVSDKEGLASKITGPMYTERLKEKMDQARAVLEGPAKNISSLKANIFLEAVKDLNQYIDARYSEDHLASFNLGSLSVLLAEFPESTSVSGYLKEEWLKLRDDNTMPRLKLLEVIRGFHAVGLLTEEQHELWSLRLRTCPGHNDEGGRSWCAYCGDMKS